MIQPQDRNALVCFIRDRFTERYIMPIEKLLTRNPHTPAKILSKEGFEIVCSSMEGQKLGVTSESHEKAKSTKTKLSTDRKRHFVSIFEK